MAQARNTPDEATVIRAEARKSFVLGLWIKDYNGNPLNITDCTIRMVVRKSVPSATVDDSANLITNATAVLTQPDAGLCQFELQASDLDFAAGDYLYSVTLVSEGYSAVILKGPFTLEQNTEFASIGDTYSGDVSMASALTIILQQQRVVEVRTGPTLAPGEATFTWAMESMLKQVFSGMVAEGQTLTADDIADGVEYVMMTVAERELLAGGLVVDWDTGITGKPAFGTAAVRNEEYFMRVGAGNADDIVAGTLHKDRVPKVADLNGMVFTTSAPAGGFPGRLTFKYTP
jgi:hypothetical protein